LKTCSFCQCAKYCNQDCQAKARPAHKALCNEIKDQRAVVDKKRAHLLESWFDGSEDKFEESVGKFWPILDARPYCRALRKLGTLWAKMAETEEDAKGFFLSKYAYMELLRLTHDDNQNVKYLLPFILLELGDVDDAFDFLKWWVWVRRPDNKSERKMDDVSKIKGHWWVPRVENIFDDFFEFQRDGGSMISYNMDNATLFALIVTRFMMAEELKKGSKESSLVKKALAKKLRPRDVADGQMKLFFK
jgi:tetratricopeptide (TPR) repeat protein